MRIDLRVHGPSAAPAFRPVTVLLALLLLTAVPGCGSDKAAQTADAPATTSDVESSSEGTMVASAEALPADPAARRSSSPRPEPVHRITLSDHRCVRFEPQWTSVRVGQSIAWHSELKSAVRIYVSPGVFSRESFLIRPGATVRTGPALAVGRFSFWTEPSACREAPRGVLLAGPGVRVQETFYASAPGVR